ncbi:hypothetical protein V8B97DRAFT_1509872 [Scleroderma yunnanense]
MRLAVASIALSTALLSANAALVARQTLPSCAASCIANANTGGCAPTDDSCLCSNQAFVSAVVSCVESSCSGNDLVEAEQYAQAICAAGVTLTETAPSTATTPSTTTAPSTTTSLSTATSPLTTTSSSTTTAPLTTTTHLTATSSSSSSTTSTSTSSTSASTATHTSGASLSYGINVFAGAAAAALAFGAAL